MHHVGMLTVLMIDDDDDDEKLADLVREYLKPHAFALRTAYDGPRGLRELERSGVRHGACAEGGHQRADRG